MSTHLPAIPDAIGPVTAPGSVHCWLLPAEQSKMTTWAPLVEPPGSVRQRPDSGLTSVLFDALKVHFWAPVPLQPHSCTIELFAVPLWLTSRQWPRICTLWSAEIVTDCAPVPLHVQIWILLPLAMPLF